MTDRPLEIQNKLLNFIRIDLENNLRINWDDMCSYLLRSGRKFSPAQLERSFNKEVESKVVGRPVTSVLFPSLCKYIEEMTRYLEFKDIETEQRRHAEVAETLRDKAKPRPKR
jgi:hypothetical protein